MGTWLDGHVLLAVGLSHHTAPVELRERLALGKDEVAASLKQLIDDRLATEAMWISTCNRVELYAVVQEDSEHRVMEVLSAIAQERPDQLRPHLYWLRERDAVAHLFRVASALDSLVVGEPQILGQVKDAIRVAGEIQSLGPILHPLTRKTLSLAKRVRTETEIGRSMVGVGSAGVSLARQIFSDLRGKRAMLVGTGEMGQQVAKALLGTGIDEVVVTNRTFERSVELARTYGGTAVPYAQMEEYLARVDIVITATGATKPILHARQVQAALKSRRSRPLFFVDLSVPRNVAPDVERLPQAFVFNVDDLTQVVEKGKAARRAASVEAEALVSSEADAFSERMAQQMVNAAIGDIARQAENARRLELERSARLLASLDPDQREAVDALTRALVKKLLHRPMAAMRDAAKSPDDRDLALLLSVFSQDD